jgi:hypothetical protein
VLAVAVPVISGAIRLAPCSQRCRYPSRCLLCSCSTLLCKRSPAQHSQKTRTHPSLSFCLEFFSAFLFRPSYNFFTAASCIGIRPRSIGKHPSNYSRPGHLWLCWECVRVAIPAYLTGYSFLLFNPHYPSLGARSVVALTVWSIFSDEPSYILKPCRLAEAEFKYLEFSKRPTRAVSFQPPSLQ